MSDESIKSNILSLASQTLDTTAEKLLYGRVESQFPWIKVGGIAWVRNPEFECGMYWIQPDQQPVWLNPPEMRGLPALSILLKSNSGDLPTSLKPIQLAEAIRRLAVEPRGYVAGKEFLEKHQPYMSAWLPEDTPEWRRRFADLCPDPRLKVDKQATWQLEFNYFNPQGGVEKWHAAGDAMHVAQATMSPAADNGTFRWPMK